MKTWPLAAAGFAGLMILFASSVWSTSQKTRQMFVELDRLTAHHRRVDNALHAPIVILRIGAIAVQHGEQEIVQVLRMLDVAF